MDKKIYLGDSVYLTNDGYHLVLTTENGYGPSNTICLEPHLIPKIQEYIDTLRKQNDKPSTNSLTKNIV